MVAERAALGHRETGSRQNARERGRTPAREMVGRVVDVFQARPLERIEAAVAVRRADQEITAGFEQGLGGGKPRREVVEMLDDFE